MSEGKAKLKKILQDVYLFEDTCNVYLVVDGDAGVLIDFGSGKVMDHIRDVGVKTIRAILHTHHHRDQAQGDHLAVGAGIPVYAPARERRLFDEAEGFWNTKQLWDMYNVRNTLFTLTKNVSTKDGLQDYKSYRFGQLEFLVLATPGHTLGSISLLAKVGGRSVAFTGDLIHSEGKVQTLYDLQYNYGATDGVEAATLSLRNLEDRQPEILLPSHGTPMMDARAAIRETHSRLVAFYRFMNNGKLPPSEVDFTQVGPHLLAATYACAFFYVILSDDGHALFVDYGSPSDPLFSPPQQHFESGERVRFLEHSLQRLRLQYGVKKIDAVIPSHYHDDHINGIPYLQREFGVECWAFERMKEILEHPEGEQIGCVCPDPIRVARTFQEAESLHWKGFTFKIHHTPGHADYHMSMFGELDGKRVGFTGDNLFLDLPQLRNATPSLIYRNHVHKTSHQITATRLLEYEPQIICTGHELQTDVHPDVYRRYMDHAKELTHHFEQLLPGETNFGLEPSWIQIYPYQISAKAGDEFEVEIRATNFYDSAADLSFDLRLPEGWECKQGIREMHIAKGTVGRTKLTVSIPGGFQSLYKRVAIAADVTFMGKHLGEITEAVVHMGGITGRE